MQIDLDMEESRLLLQGIWKELVHYQGICDRAEANSIALNHAEKMQKRLWILEEKIIEQKWNENS
jgi:hypothetical protein